MSVQFSQRLDAGILRAELSRRNIRDRLRDVGLRFTIAPAPEVATLSDEDLVRALDESADDRREIGDAPAPAPEQFSSIAAVIPLSHHLKRKPDGDWTLTAPMLGEFLNVRAEEPFRNQPIAAIGAAFLINRQVVVTAHHVIPNAPIAGRVRLVFGYRLNGQTAPSVLSAADVYEATPLWANPRRDIALLRLDRPVMDRAALQIRMDREVRDGEGLYAMGFPTGLPGKFADNGSVQARTRAFFTTDLDIIRGNSGSPVFSAVNNQVVGVVSTAPFGFTPVNGRLVSDFSHDPNDVAVGVSKITNLPI